MVVLVHCIVLTWLSAFFVCTGLPPVLRFFQNKELSRKVARECLSGDKSICLAITEPTGRQTTRKQMCNAAANV